MGLLETINADLKSAMRERARITIDTLRLVIADCTNRHIAAGTALTEEQLLDVVQSQIKKRREAREEFVRGQRMDLVTQTDAEIDVLKRYLPPQLSNEELSTLIAQAVAATGAAGPKDMGKVMQALMPQVKGKADNRTISQLVKERLG